MIPFQFAGIAVCMVFAGWGLYRLHRRQRPRSVSLLAVGVGSLGAITIFDPEITTRVARVVGIARGADLLLYLVALAFLASWFYFYQRVRSLSVAVTALVRELAIRDAQASPRPDGLDRQAPGSPGAEARDRR